MEFMEKDSLRMEFIQSIVRNGERKSQESNGTADETVQAPVYWGSPDLFCRDFHRIIKETTGFILPKIRAGSLLAKK